MRKAWAGQTNPQQPTSVTVQLKKNGANEGDEIRLDANNSWSHTWSGLSTADTWTVEETSELPAGYTTAYSGDAADGFVITNTYRQPNITLTAHKVWDGDADPDQPTSVTVQLYGNNTAYRAEQTLNAANSWRCTWADLDPSVTWTVRETTALSNNYSTAVHRQGNDFTVTNTYTSPVPPNISILATKVWDGDTNPNQPTSVQLRLNRDGAPFDTQTVNAATNWAHTWTGLDPERTWTVEELTALPAGYTSLVTGNAADGFVVTNTYTTQYGRLTLGKTVSGELADRTKSWTFTVVFSGGGSYSYAGSKSGTLTSGETITLKHGESVTFTGIPTGTTYRVTEREANANGYVTESTGATGTISSTLSTAEFSNYKSKYPKLGDDGGMALWTTAALLSAAGMYTVYRLLRVRRTRKTGTHKA